MSLFLIYMEFLPKSGGWATSILWAMMILPIADALQNTLQNLISRIAGVNNDDLANRGIGMARAMANSIGAITYQFKPAPIQSSNQNVTAMKMNLMETNKMNTTTINKANDNKEQASQMNTNSIKDNKVSIGAGKKILNTGKEFLNMGMYMAEGRNFDTSRNYNRNNINNTRREDYKKENNENTTIINEQEDDDV